MQAVTSLWRELMDLHASFDPRFRFSPDADREFARHMNESLHSRSSRVLVAEIGSAVVGYILGEIHTRKPIYPLGTYGFISDICVKREYRRRGVGKGLVEGLMGWFKARGVTAVELFVAEANPDSAAFWLAMGCTGYLRMLRMETDV